MENTIHDIYCRLQDEKSRNIFSNRLLFNLTKDMRFLKNVVKESCVYDRFCTIFKNLGSDKKIIIFGAGELGKWFYELFEDNEYFCTECFIDNNKSGELKKIPIVSLKTYGEKIKSQKVFVCSWLYHQELCNELYSCGCLKENIINVVDIIHEIWDEKQYFDLEPLCKLRTEQEVFIDGGCFNGKNSLRFSEWCNKRFKKIYAFEPDYKNFEKCRTAFDSFMSEDKYELYNMGLGKCKNTFTFIGNNGAGSRISSSGDENIKVTDLDSLVKEKVTYIKLDIEGAEYDAISGAKQIIQKYKPKMAVCVYHKVDDLWKLPSLILQYNPDYKFYLRHYSVNSWETVLYAL